MENDLKFSGKNDLLPKKTLDQLFSLLASTTLPLAFRRKSCMVHEAPCALPIVIDGDILSSVFLYQ